VSAPWQYALRQFWHSLPLKHDPSHVFRTTIPVSHLLTIKTTSSVRTYTPFFALNVELLACLIAPQYSQVAQYLELAEVLYTFIFYPLFCFGLIFALLCLLLSSSSKSSIRSFSTSFGSTFFFTNS